MLRLRFAALAPLILSAVAVGSWAGGGWHPSQFQATLALICGVGTALVVVSLLEQGVTWGDECIYFLRDRDGFLLRIGHTTDWPGRYNDYLRGSDDDAIPGLSGRVGPGSGPVRWCGPGRVLRLERRRIEAISACAHHPKRRPLLSRELANDQHLIEADEWQRMTPLRRCRLTLWGWAYRTEAALFPHCYRWEPLRGDISHANHDRHQPPITVSRGVSGDARADTVEAMPHVIVTRSAQPDTERPQTVSTPAPPPPPTDTTPADLDEPSRWDLGDGMWVHADLDGELSVGPVPDPPRPDVSPFPLYYVEGSVSIHADTDPIQPTTDSDLTPSDLAVSACIAADTEAIQAGEGGIADLDACIAALRLSGETVRSIAKTLGVSVGKVQRSLKRSGSDG